MRRFFMFFLGIACFLFSSACGMLSEAPPAPPARRAPVEGYMASAAIGDSTRLDDPAFGKNVTVVMENSFTSASGEECRRASVIVGAKEAEVVVVCRDASGQWAMVPRVWGQGIEKP
ncbi:MAG: putative membrane-bound lipoprotein [Candidatus Desulfovibrio kirbyi]|uniref:Putative membrane-bound lipoprotein n=1 Tax=Candidatus Desulfovibrio kirbyi TaxID=2696086 RepID=A0A6L2R5K5_9BACT|nr:MAG: putative membrane-bound lipoprotein [Candidatus Desulfovibrio kirbyi]